MHPNESPFNKVSNLLSYSCRGDIAKCALLIQNKFPDIMATPSHVSLAKTLTVRNRSKFYRNVRFSVVKTTSAEKFLRYESFARVF